MVDSISQNIRIPIIADVDVRSKHAFKGFSDQEEVGSIHKSWIQIYVCICLSTGLCPTWFQPTGQGPGLRASEPTRVLLKQSTG